MVTEIKATRYPTVREIAHSLDMLSPELLKLIKNAPDNLFIDREEWKPETQVTENEFEAIINYLIPVKKVSPPSWTLLDLIDRYQFKRCHTVIAEAVGFVVDFNFTWQHLLKAIAVEWRERGYQWQKIKNLEREQETKALESGRMPIEAKIEKLEQLLYRQCHEYQPTADTLEALEYLRKSHRLEIKRELDRVTARGAFLGVLLLSAIAFTGLIGIIEASEKLCHPGGDATVYRDSAYCVQLKSLEEFFIGKGQLR